MWEEKVKTVRPRLPVPTRPAPNPLADNDPSTKSVIDNIMSGNASLPEGIDITKIRLLDLSSQKLHELPSCLLQLKMLQTLNLSSNKLHFLPRTLSNLSSNSKLTFRPYDAKLS